MTIVPQFVDLNRRCPMHTDDFYKPFISIGKVLILAVHAKVIAYEKETSAIN
jgi:hypothetical protein